MKTQRNRSRKINSKGKSYHVCDSPFFKMSSKKKLAELLLYPLATLVSLSRQPCYNVFQMNGNGGKAREIQQPLDELDIVHTRVASLLSRINIPVNIHSGTKQRSHITNAKEHLSKSSLITTDISKFFPNTTMEMVYRFFHHELLTSGDVAQLLSELCCYDKHVPTGSRLSMILAYWANYKMFEEIQSLSLKHNVTFSIYVDDC